MVDEIIVRTRSSIKILLFAQNAVGSRERPQQTGVEDSPLVGILHKASVAGHLSVVAAALMVGHAGNPETQDVLL